jgi:adenylate kinase
VQRDDDTEEALRQQIETWRQEADEIKEYYDEQGILTIVNAEQDASKVTEDILEALGYPERAP